MSLSNLHTFHIPVMGLGYTIDTPLKVARFGISSVISVIDDSLCEQMREYHCNCFGEEYIPILKEDDDSRARRFTAYLNMMNRVVNRQIQTIKAEPFEEGTDIYKYFRLLPDTSPIRILFNEMLACDDNTQKMALQEELRSYVCPGSIDVNIMTKLDRLKYTKTGELMPPEFSDALSSLRGFALSDINAAIVFSAGLNPRMFTYCETFKDFFPDDNAFFKKQIILKVSDFRSAIIQGKFLAKKGLWISEFRIESGLNCGGHLFPSDGYLMGPILEEFKTKRDVIYSELVEMCRKAWSAKGIPFPSKPPKLRFTVQGGIGTAKENDFLINHYEMDGTGWATPFLLVPEVTNVEDETLHNLATAVSDDYVISDASPLGVPFSNFTKSINHKQRIKRIEDGKPGSPCHNKYLAFNTEFEGTPLCTASRKYQHLKINQLKESGLSPETLQSEIDKVTVKECICDGLGTPALLKNKILKPGQQNFVSICPGPNLAFFSGVFSLREMVDHIYGRINLLNTKDRPHMFINELNISISYLKKEIEKCLQNGIHPPRIKNPESFKANLLEGINYYKQLFRQMKEETERYCETMLDHLKTAEIVLKNLFVPVVEK